MSNEVYVSARYLPFGDSALLIKFGNTVNLNVNRKVTALSEAIQNTNIKGIEELVPTYCSLLVRYNPLKTTYEQLVFRVQDVEKSPKELRIEPKRRKIVVPVVYGSEYGPDLAYVAQHHALSEEEVVRLHVIREYRVYMIGFVAGFPYLGEIAEEIATPRLETPRIKVPAGSVGIAEKQTGIYPCEAPGGWRIIGRTPIKLFNPSRRPPALLKTGDVVEFKPISEKEFKSLEASAGRNVPADFADENR
jgi:KipI family sensor histidine kinase inhibitor